MLSAALPPAVRKASGFPAHAASFLVSAQAGRLSLPAGAEEVVRETRATERRSLSAQRAAEPQVAARRIERGLDKPDFISPERQWKEKWCREMVSGTILGRPRFRIVFSR